VRIDVRQAGVSVPGYPADLFGEASAAEPLPLLKLSEFVQERMRA
jgi:hypothetical protein